MDTSHQPDGPAAAPRAGRRLLRFGLAIGLVAALLGTFRLYLAPDLLLDVGTFMTWCGLR